MLASVNSVRLCVSPAQVKTACKIQRANIQKARATGSNETTEPSIDAEKLVADLQEKWDKVEEKPAAIGIAVSAVIALYALNGVVNAVDTIPIVSSALELVGLFVTAWFVYRYLIFGPDREELKENIDSFWVKVSGKK